MPFFASRLFGAAKSKTARASFCEPTTFPSSSEESDESGSEAGDLPALPLCRPQQLDGAGSFPAAWISRRSNDRSLEGKQLRACKHTYHNLHVRHRGSNCIVMEGSSGGVKVIIKSFSLTGKRLGYRQKELELVRAAGSIPNVMRLMDTAIDTESTYTVLEACPGCTLPELMAGSRGGRITEAYCARHVIIPILQALAGLHASNIVHRHLKPDHIICGRAGGAVLVDLTDAAHLTEPHCLTVRVGELQYMAPEMLSKPSTQDVFREVLSNGLTEEELPRYNEKVDVWSLGVVIIESLTGRQPFPADSLSEMAAVQRSMLGEASSAGGIPAFLLRHGLSAACVDFLASVFREDPARRPGAGELLRHAWLQQPSAEGVA